MPACPIEMWPGGKQDRDTYNKFVAAFHTNVQAAVNNVHSFFDGEDKRGDLVENWMWKTYTLDFTGVLEEKGELSSNVVFSDAGKTEELDFDIITTEETTNTAFGFKVAIVGQGGRKIERNQPKKSA